MKHIILAVIALMAISCEKATTEIEPIYDFVLYTQPTSNTITEGQTLEIVCKLHKSHFYSKDAEFTISYNQVAGSGTLTMNSEEFRAERVYTLPNGEFIIDYTAFGEEHHEIKITVTDQFSNTEVSTIKFTNN